MPRETNDTAVTIEGYAFGETAKALNFEIHTISGEEIASPKKEWFPFSQLKKIVRQPKNSQERDMIIVSEWICKQKGLI